MEVCCVFLLESPNWGDSNEYTQHTVFNIKRRIRLNYPKSAAKGFFLGTQEHVRNSCGKRAISVRATEVLLYMSFSRLYQKSGYWLYLSNLEPSKLLFSVTFTLEEIHQIYHNCKIVIVYTGTYLSKFQDFHQIIINTVCCIIGIGRGGARPPQ